MTADHTNRPRVMLNPSCQFENTVEDEHGNPIYNEAVNMYDIAVAVCEAIESDGRIDAFLSRDSREASSNLREETRMTRELNCDALVALHSDSAQDSDDPGGGTWSFYADEDGKRLAGCVHARLLNAIRSFYPEVVDRGVRTHWKRLWVLHESGCPACLTEVLFHSNPKERKMLTDPRCRRIIAQSIARGVLDFFGLDGGK